MAITISVLTTPSAFEPVNAPLWFRLNSTSSGLTDFKYIFRPEYRIEPFSTTSFTTLGTYRIPPKPVNGDGLFSPHRALKSFLNTNSTIVNPFITGFTASSSSALIDYRIIYGLEYNPDLFFTDTISVSGNMGLTFSSAHDFAVGDIITIDKSNKSFNPEYDGTASVVSIPNSLSIKTNKTFSSTLLANESGYVVNNFRLSGTSSGYKTWNGTRQYEERATSFLPYLIATQSGQTGEFLTNLYNTTLASAKPIETNDYETLSFCLNETPLIDYYLYVNTYDVNGNITATYSSATMSVNTHRRLEIGVGPANLTNVNFTNVNSYRVYLRKITVPGPFPTFTVSEFRYYKINTQCSNYEKQRLVFLNRLGGFDYFSFTLDSKRTMTISRIEYEKTLAFDYTIGDRGKSILAQKAEEKMTLNSNWLTENESIWLEELLTSPDVYILTTNNTKLPIIITDTSYEIKTYLRNQLFNLVLNYKFAYDINLQNE
jgi:hypothetical protein